MKKKIIIIVILTILLIIDFGFNLRYSSNRNKVSIFEEVSSEDLIQNYAVDFFELLKKGEYKEAYDKIEISNFMSYDEFKNYISTNIIANDNLVSVFECEYKNNYYEMIISIAPPLFSSIELESKPQYRNKNVKINAKLDGVFDYRILNFEIIKE